MIFKKRNFWHFWRLTRWKMERRLKCFCKCHRIWRLSWCSFWSYFRRSSNSMETSQVLNRLITKRDVCLFPCWNFSTTWKLKLRKRFLWFKVLMKNSIFWFSCSTSFFLKVKLGGVVTTTLVRVSPQYLTMFRRVLCLFLSCFDSFSLHFARIFTYF